MLVFRFDLDLIVAGETIHKRKHFTPRTCIYDLVNEWCGVTVLRIGFIEVSKICTNANSPLLFYQQEQGWIPIQSKLRDI